ncbi:hypothetical protein [Phytoactinopolyspora mesophila]|uniref:Uncharacterized protein n=1 Tax=Phytoactinopolyspora mesophila TaxID=2650750 RepID=A0A7K3M8S5_9ACTN|nr:hypothetical protein [Phytoactinopolyspora mesophila]NDL58818.1 hypothetical protein [Phytoactinopolyspora mesophila]
MSSPNQHSSDSTSAPSNRAARRAKGKGKAGAEQPSLDRRGGPLRDSQVKAQPKLKGRRGNR